MKLSLAFVLVLFAVSVRPQTAVVVLPQAELRGTPNDTGRGVDRIKRDATVEILKQNGAWFLVQSVNFAGWIRGDSIKIVNTEKDAVVVPGLGGTERVTEGTAGGATIIEQATQPSTSRPATEPGVRTKQKTESRTYIRGPRGGCYYINSSGKKTYVDRGYCG